MTVSIALDRGSPELHGTVRTVSGTVTFDDSYPASGETMALSTLGLTRVDSLLFDSPSGYEVAWDGSQQTPKAIVRVPRGSFTDSTTGTASTTLAAGVGHYKLVHPLTSLATGLSTSAIDIMTTYTVGHKFKITSFDFVTTVAGTGTSASQTFNIEIGTTNLTGGSLVLTLASQATIGTVTSATAITAANTGSASATISIEMAASGTVFTAGAGYFLIGIQNMDTADAFASLLASDQVATASDLQAVTARFTAIGL